MTQPLRPVQPSGSSLVRGVAPAMTLDGAERLTALAEVTANLDHAASSILTACRVLMAKPEQQHHLTPEQYEVVRLAATDMTYIEIAAALGLTEPGVKYRMSRALRAYGADTAIGLFAALGWLRVPA